MMNKENYEYTTDDGKTVTIPAGFAPSQIDGENTVEDGLVIIDSNGNEFVWIDVPIRNNDNEENLEGKDDTDAIYDELVKYVGDYRKGASRQEYENWKDEFYYGCGLDNVDCYDELKSKILKSMVARGGFWVGRYEAGANVWRSEYTEIPKETSLMSLSQAGKYPLIYIRMAEAYYIASNCNSDSYETSLMLGIQWDLIEKFFESSNAMTYEQMNNSTNFGNFNDSSFTITNCPFFFRRQVEGIWSQEQGYLDKTSGEMVILPTRCE